MCIRYLLSVYPILSVFDTYCLCIECVYSIPTVCVSNVCIRYLLSVYRMCVFDTCLCIECVYSIPTVCVSNVCIQCLLSASNVCIQYSQFILFYIIILDVKTVVIAPNKRHKCVYVYCNCDNFPSGHKRC